MSLMTDCFMEMCVFAASTAEYRSRLRWPRYIGGRQAADMMCVAANERTDEWKIADHRDFLEPPRCACPTQARLGFRSGRSVTGSRSECAFAVHETYRGPRDQRMSPTSTLARHAELRDSVHHLSVDL